MVGGGILQAGIAQNSATQFRLRQPLSSLDATLAALSYVLQTKNLRDA
jgi:hypothetical protein